MPVFEVSITRLISTGDVKTKYLMKLHREFPQVGQSAFTGFSDDAAFCEALARLGLPEPQQQRMLSALHRGETMKCSPPTSRTRWPDPLGGGGEE